MSRHIAEIEKMVDNYIIKLEGWNNFFTDKINKQGDEANINPENQWSIAYESPYSQIKEAGVQTGGSGIPDKPIPHKQKRLVDDIHKELNSMKARSNLFIPTIKYMEGELQNSFKSTNNKIKREKEVFESADANYRIGKNMNSATGILKIDSYDRNIEENFYIMYYLLSYGVLGFFIYKLLKL